MPRMAMERAKPASVKHRCEDNMISDAPSLYKMLPRADCGECGRQTCLSFAKDLAAGRAVPDACPYVAQKCPKCKYTQEMFFRKCPKCGVSIQELRLRQARVATTCPRCGYAAGKPFDECPQCGVSMAVIAKATIKAEPVAKPKTVQAPAAPKPGRPVAAAPTAAKAARPEKTPRAARAPEPKGKPKLDSVTDMTAAPKPSVDTEAYFKKKSSPTRHCPYCGFTTQEDIAECPQCGQSGEWQTVG